MPSPTVALLLPSQPDGFKALGLGASACLGLQAAEESHVIATDTSRSARTFTCVVHR
jgi:hypothetical protein